MRTADRRWKGGVRVVERQVVSETAIVRERLVMAMLIVEMSSREHRECQVLVRLGGTYFGTFQPDSDDPAQAGLNNKGR